MMAGEGKAGTAPPLEIAAYDRLEAVAEDWRTLEAEAVGTLFETHAWCAAWQETVGTDRGVTPLIVTGRAEDGRLVFLLPFGVGRHSLARVARWLSAPHLNYGFGLYDERFLKRCGGTLAPYWPRIRALIAPHADALHLETMPPEWNGVRHPLAALFTMRGANMTYLMRLYPADADNVAGHRSGQTRRTARKRDARLEAAGALSFGLPRNTAEAREVLAAMFAQNERRLRELGIAPPFDSTVKCFFDRLLEPAGAAPSPLAPYHLALDGEVIATALGGIHGDVYHALILAMTDGPLRNLSPGDAVLRRTIAACAARGLELFDLAPGYGRYKSALADEEMPLYETVLALSPRGLAHAAAARTGVAVKRRIKKSPGLWQLATRLRRARAALTG